MAHWKKITVGNLLYDVNQLYDEKLYWKPGFAMKGGGGLMVVKDN